MLYGFSDSCNCKFHCGFHFFLSEVFGEKVNSLILLQSPCTSSTLNCATIHVQTQGKGLKGLPDHTCARESTNKDSRLCLCMQVCRSDYKTHCIYNPTFIERNVGARLLKFLLIPPSKYCAQHQNNLLRCCYMGSIII